jgi:hypothetical protein
VTLLAPSTGRGKNAYDVMDEWNAATGRQPGSDKELDEQVQATLAGEDEAAASRPSYLRACV